MYGRWWITLAMVGIAAATACADQGAELSGSAWTSGTAPAGQPVLGPHVTPAQFAPWYVPGAGEQDPTPRSAANTPDRITIRRTEPAVADYSLLGTPPRAAAAAAAPSPRSRPTMVRRDERQAPPPSMVPPTPALPHMGGGGFPTDGRPRGLMGPVVTPSRDAGFGTFPPDPQAGFRVSGSGTAAQAAMGSAAIERSSHTVGWEEMPHMAGDREAAGDTRGPLVPASGLGGVSQASYSAASAGADAGFYAQGGLYRRPRYDEPVHWHPLFREHAYLNRPWHAGAFAGGFLGDTLSEEGAAKFDLDEGPVGGVHLGYDFDSMFGVEGSMAFASADVRGPFGDEADLFLFDVSAVFYPIGVSERWIPYVTGGVGFTDFNFDALADTTAFTVPFGFGVKFPLSERWLLRVDFRDHLALTEGGFYQTMNNFTITAGFEFRFGRPAGLE